MTQYCHLVKGFRHALKQLVGISNMLYKLVLVEVTFRFNLRFKHLLLLVITSQAYLSCGLTSPAAKLHIWAVRGFGV